MVGVIFRKKDHFTKTRDSLTSLLICCIVDLIYSRSNFGLI